VTLAHNYLQRQRRKQIRNRLSLRVTCQIDQATRHLHRLIGSTVVSGDTGNESHINIKYIGDPLERSSGWSGGTALDTTDVALIHSTTLSQVSLGRPVLLTQHDQPGGQSRTPARKPRSELWPLHRVVPAISMGPLHMCATCNTSIPQHGNEPISRHP